MHNHPRLNNTRQIIYLHSKCFEDKLKLNKPFEILIQENVDFHTNHSSIDFDQEKNYRSF